MKPIAEKLSPEERVIVAASELAEADSDHDYQAARKKVLQAARALMPRVKAEILRGPGRPQEVDRERVAELLVKHRAEPGKIYTVARKLGVHAVTIWRIAKQIHDMQSKK